MATSRIYKTEGLILKRRNIGETDRLLTIFTKEYGKIIVVAKGIRKITSRRAPYVEVFSHAALLVHKTRTQDILTEANPINGFGQLRKNLTLVNAAYYLCELTDVLTAQKQEARDVFRILTQSFLRLNEGGIIDITAFTEEFALTILRMLGFLPYDRNLGSNQIQRYVESITEKKMKTYQFLTKF